MPVAGARLDLRLRRPESDGLLRNALVQGRGASSAHASLSQNPRANPQAMSAATNFYAALINQRLG